MYDELVKRIHEQAVYLPEKFSKNAELLDVLMKAADAIEELEGKHFMMKKTAEWLAEKVPHWIPVTERLPKEETPVQVTYLGYNDKKPRTDMIACLYCGYWCYWDGVPCGYNKCKVEVTHWMPLQPAPKEE